MAINASTGGQLQGGSSQGGGGLTQEDVQDIVADQIEVGSDINIGLQAAYDDATGKLVLSLSGATPGSGSSGSLIVKENGTARGTATTLNFVGPSIDVSNNIATITGGLDNISIYENASNRGNFTSINFVSGATVSVIDGTANVTIAGGGGSSNFSGDYNDLTNKPFIPSQYNLPTASIATLGGVKIDGTTILIDGNGVISAVGGGSGGGISIGDVGTYLTNNGYTTTTYVDGQISNLINGAPGALNTLNELAAAIASNPNFASDLTTSLAGKLNLSGGTMTGALTLSGAPTTTLQAATKGYVDSAIAAIPTPTTALASLTDVNVASKTSGQVLGWNGTSWVAVNNSGAKGDTGATGAQGPAGLSISSATVSLAGKLLITLSNNNVVDAGSVAGVSSAAVNGSGDLVLTKQDGTTINAGSVIGPKGDTGATGATGAKGDTGATGSQGLGIYSVVVDGNGNLLVTLNDSSTINAGSVIGPQGAQGAAGPAGRHIADGGVVVDTNGYLQITLSDGVTINAGYVVGSQGSTGPTGAKGDTGATGAKGDKGDTGATGTSYTINNKSGTVQVYGLNTTTQPGYDLEVDLSNKANKLTTARNIALTGKVTGLVSFDGSANVSMTTAISGVTTSDVAEGTNQYHTDFRSRNAISAQSDGNITSLINYDSATGIIKYRANTSYITEGSNLYFTNTRADARADVRIGAASINALVDVDTVTAAPTNGQVLTWTGSAWTPTTVSGGGSSAVSSVNSKTGTVTLSTDDIGEGNTNLYYTTSRWDTRLGTKTTDNLNEGTTNKYFTDARARNALAAGTGLTYNSGTGTFSINASTTNVTEGSNLYYTTARFDTRLGQSNLSQLSDVADTTPVTGQSLVWNGSAWAPSTVSSGGEPGGTGSSGIYRAAAQIEYDASGNLTSATVLNGGINATIATATASVATVTFTFAGSACAPLSVQIYSYQRSTNTYVTRGIGTDFSTRTIAGGGSSGSPTAFTAFDPSTNTMTLSLKKAETGATSSVGQTTHVVVQFLLSS